MVCVAWFTLYKVYCKKNAVDHELYDGKLNQINSYDNNCFDLEKAKQIEVLVCEEFGCSIYDIVCYANTFFKKVVVFLLVTEHGFKKEYRFKIPNYLFNAPTVVSEIEYQIKKYSGITASIQRIKEQLHYEKVMD
jgi:hypothetical protein